MRSWRHRWSQDSTKYRAADCASCCSRHNGQGNARPTSGCDRSGATAGCVTPAGGGIRTLDRVSRAATTFVPCGRIAPAPGVQSRWGWASVSMASTWYTMPAPMWTGALVSATCVGAWRVVTVVGTHHGECGIGTMPCTLETLHCTRGASCATTSPGYEYVVKIFWRRV